MSSVASVAIYPPPITPSVVPKKYGMREACITSIDTVLNYGGFSAVTNLGSNINRAIGVAFSGVKQSSAAAGLFFKGSSELTNLANSLNGVRYWIKGEYTKSMEFISQIFFTIRGMIVTTAFMAEQGLFSLGKLAVSIGQLPVVSLVTGSLLSFGMIFSGVDNYRDYKKVSVEQKRFHDHIAELQGQLNSGELLEEEKVVIEAKISQANTAIEANKIRLNIHKIAMIRSVATVVFQALMLLGMATGWGALAMTGAFLLTFSIVNAASWVGSSFYGIKHAEVKSMKKFDEFIAPDLELAALNNDTPKRRASI